MNAKLIAQEGNYWFQFKVLFGDSDYRATITLSGKGKFLDEEIEYFGSGEELEYEGEEGDIREKIGEFLSDHWDTLTAKK